MLAAFAGAIVRLLVCSVQLLFNPGIDFVFCNRELGVQFVLVVVCLFVYFAFGK